MFQHILVPLDGSDLAESALPAAAYLARVLGARVTLVHIIERGAPATVHGERHLTGEKEAEVYLENVARSAFTHETRVERHVHTALTHDVAEGIVAHQYELVPDLIVMCTHGRHGLREVIIGSIAQKVIASGRTPVLLIRPDPRSERRRFQCRTVLAPVDAEPKHAAGLETAVGLAAATGAHLCLLSVVATPRRLSGQDAARERFMPSATRAMLHLTADDFRSYLERESSRIRARSVEVTAEVRYGDTGSVIAESAEAHDASVIVLGTHGARGGEAFWSHSVGAEVQGKTKRPLLLVPVRDEALRATREE